MAFQGPLSTSQYALYDSKRQTLSTASVVGVSLRPGYCLQKTKLGVGVGGWGGEVGVGC